MSTQLTRKDFRFLLFLLVVHAFFFLLALNYKRIYMGDSFEYVYMALNINDQFWFYSGNPAMPLMPEYLTLRPPLYSLFLASVYLFTVNNWLVIFLQNLLSVFNIFYLRDTVKNLGFDTKYDYILMALVVLYPAQFVHTNTIAPDLMLQTSVLVYFRHFIWLFKKRTWQHALWMSLALIAGVFVKPVLYPFALVHCILLVSLATYFKAGLLRSFAAGLLPVLCIVLYMFWNYQRTDKFHFSSTQSFNAIYYYYFYFGDKNGIDAAQQFLQSERDKIAAMPEFKNRYDYANRRGVQLLKDNFASYMPYHLKHSARLLIDPGKGELDMFTGNLTLGKLYKKQSTGFYATIKEKGWKGLTAYSQNNPTFPLIMIILAFNMIRLLGLLLFAFSRQYHLYIRLFVLGLICYFSITTGPIANTRYFMPVSLIAIGCATLGFQAVLRRQQNKAIITQQNN